LSVQVRYPFHDDQPDFPEQKTHAQLFDWRPDARSDWEMSFYQSLKEVDGVALLGGGDSTMIAGLVAMGHRVAILALPAFGGAAKKIWQSLRPGRDLPSPDEVSLMAQPDWSADLAVECVQSLKDQLARRAEEERRQRLESLRQETSITKHALLAVAVFILSMLCIPLAWGLKLTLGSAIGLLFFSPLLAGVAGSTIRLVFDLRRGALPLSRQSTITTAALGLIAGGVAGTLFVAAQVNILESAQVAAQTCKLVPLGVIVGFIAGLTLDAVFRKLIASDVVDLSAVDKKKHP
jgi:ABC-type Co2+ transport system permease subunit